MSTTASQENITEDTQDKKWRPTLKENLVILLLLVIYILFNLLGAYIFVCIEKKPSIERENWFTKFKEEFVSNHSSCLSKPELESFIEKSTIAVEEGQVMLGNSSVSVSETRWTLNNAYLLAITIASTIGYGVLTPATPGGQVFCIFYALLSIPFTGLLAAKIGTALAYHIEQASSKAVEKFSKAKIVGVVLTFVAGILLYIVLPSIVLRFVGNEEGWTYIECLYTVIITLTTVGFGDYVPDPSSHGGIYTTMFVTVWVIAGLAWFATIFNLIAAIMSERAVIIRKEVNTRKSIIINRVKQIKHPTPKLSRATGVAEDKSREQGTN